MNIRNYIPLSIEDHGYFKKYRVITLFLIILLLTISKYSHPDTSSSIKMFTRGGVSSFSTIPEEEMVYDMSFLWFKRAAEGRVSFKRVSKDEFIATLDAETKGFIGWLFYRHHRYVSHIKATGNKDLRSILFERTVITRMKEERSINEIDYEKGELRWWVYRNGELYKKEKQPIPKGTVYEDVLSAFYKFRYGLYGDIIKGKEYIVDTIPEKGASRVTIRVATEKEEARERKYTTSIKGNDEVYLVYVTVPKEIFGSRSGIVKIWFRNDLIPLEGVVEDAIGLGDVSGVLRERKIS